MVLTRPMHFNASAFVFLGVLLEKVLYNKMIRKKSRPEKDSMGVRNLDAFN